MHINIILDYKNGLNTDQPILEIINRENNYLYLSKGDKSREFPCLSLVEINDPTVFGEKDMDNLMSDLEQVKDELHNLDDIKHIEDIIALCKKCKETPNTVLVFTG